MMVVARVVRMTVTGSRRNLSVGRPSAPRPRSRFREPPNPCHPTCRRVRRRPRTSMRLVSSRRQIHLARRVPGARGRRVYHAAFPSYRLPAGRCRMNLRRELWCSRFQSPTPRRANDSRRQAVWGPLPRGACHTRKSSTLPRPIVRSPANRFPATRSGNGFPRPARAGPDPKMWWSDPGSTKMPGTHWTAPLLSLLACHCLACPYPSPTQLVWVEPVILR